MTAHEETRSWLALSAAGLLDPGEERRLREHVRECAACAGELEALGALASGLRAPAGAGAVAGTAGAHGGAGGGRAGRRSGAAGGAGLALACVLAVWVSSLFSWSVYEILNGRRGGPAAAKPGRRAGLVRGLRDLYLYGGSGGGRVDRRPAPARKELHMTSVRSREPVIPMGAWITAPFAALAVFIGMTLLFRMAEGPPILGCGLDHRAAGHGRLGDTDRLYIRRRAPARHALRGVDAAGDLHPQRHRHSAVPPHARSAPGLLLALRRDHAGEPRFLPPLRDQCGGRVWKLPTRHPARLDALRVVRGKSQRSAWKIARAPRTLQWLKVRPMPQYEIIRMSAMKPKRAISW